MDDVILKQRWAARTRRRGTANQGHQRLGHLKGKTSEKCSQLGFMCFLQELVVNLSEKQKLRQGEGEKKDKEVEAKNHRGVGVV